MADQDPQHPPSETSPNTPRVEPPVGQQWARGQTLPDWPDEPPLDAEDGSLADVTLTHAPENPVSPTVSEEEEQWPESPWSTHPEDEPSPAVWDENEHQDLGLPQSASAPPPDEPDNHFKTGVNPDTPQDREIGLFEHLGELRARLLYCVFAVAGAMIITWNYSLTIQEWFAAPILKVLKAAGGTPISTHPTGFFVIYFQFSLVSALILVMPFVIFQAWRFIEPALTKNERRYGTILIPFSTLLFFGGVALGYSVSPLFYKFFLMFQPPGVPAMWDYHETVVMMAKMLLIFGITFQVPVVTIFLNKVGIVSRNMLIQYWRHAVVVIFTVVAILTPTWDPVSLLVCAGPPCLLYLLSIWLVKWL